MTDLSKGYSTPNKENVMPFLKAILGACSITKTVLGAYDRIPPDPDDRDDDYRADMAKMRVLCLDLDLEESGIESLEKLLDLRDLFVNQGRQASAAQAEFAGQLRDTYLDWIFANFTFLRRSSTG